MAPEVCLPVTVACSFLPWHACCRYGVIGPGVNEDRVGRVSLDTSTHTHTGDADQRVSMHGTLTKSVQFLQDAIFMNQHMREMSSCKNLYAYGVLEMEGGIVWHCMRDKLRDALRGE